MYQQPSFDADKFWTKVQQFPTITVDDQFRQIRAHFASTLDGARDDCLAALANGVPTGVVVRYWIPCDKGAVDFLLAEMTANPSRFPNAMPFELFETKVLWDDLAQRQDFLVSAKQMLEDLFAQDKPRTYRMLRRAIEARTSPRVVLEYTANSPVELFEYLLEDIEQTDEGVFSRRSALQVASSLGGITTTQRAMELLKRLPSVGTFVGNCIISAVANSRKDLGEDQTDELLMGVFNNQKGCPDYRIASFAQVCKARPAIRPGSPATLSLFNFYASMFDPVEMAEDIRQFSEENLDAYWRALGYPRTPEVTKAIMLALASGMGKSQSTKMRLCDSMSGAQGNEMFQSFSACFNSATANKEAVLDYWLGVDPDSLLQAVSRGIAKG